MVMNKQVEAIQALMNARNTPAPTPANRMKVQLGKLEEPLRKFANDRNISYNAAICMAVKDFLNKQE
jgi:hypothetical protein